MDKKTKNKIRFTIYAFTLTAAFSLSGLVFAADNATYKLLQPLPGVSGAQPLVSVGGTGHNPFIDYISYLVPFTIGLAALLAVVEIVVGGLEYGFSISPGTQTDGKERMQYALYGLLIALTSYLVLKTINPDLVNLKFGIPSLNLNAPTPSAPVAGNGPWTTQDEQTQLSTRPGGTITCFTYNSTIDRRGTFTFGDSSKTIDQLMAQCQQQCVQASQTNGTQASCVANINQTNNSPIILPSQAHCDASGQCSVLGTGQSCTTSDTCPKPAVAPPNQNSYCVLDYGGDQPNCTTHQEILRPGCVPATCAVATPIKNTCPNATAQCVIK